METKKSGAATSYKAKRPQQCGKKKLTDKGVKYCVNDANHGGGCSWTVES